MTQSGSILIATEAVADAELVRRILLGEFQNVVISTDAVHAVRDFETHRPALLVLAFDELAKSERYYLGLYRLSTLIHSIPHRTVILTGKNDLSRVYELCQKEYFYDYVLFWPLNHDALRLPMTVRQGLRDLAQHSAGAPTVADFAAQARRLADMEGVVEQATQGSQHIELAGRSLQQAQHDIGAALEGFSRRLARSGNGNPLEGAERAGLVHEIDQLKSTSVDKRLHEIGVAMQPLRQWAGRLQKDLAPQAAAVGALKGLAARVRRVVLVVEDDEFQHKLLKRLLADVDLELIHARSGVEALAMLNKRRPDLVLMDLNLPDIDGLEVTRRLKAIEALALIPVVMITGESGKNVVVDSLNAGATDFVVKPFDKKTLVAKVLKCIAAAP